MAGFVFAVVAVLAGVAEQDVKPAASKVKPPAVVPMTSSVPVSFVRPKVDCKVKKCVALTFDDGPGEATGRLLEMLNAADAKVTFFVVGPNADKHSDVIRLQIQDGHEVGNHTEHHLELPRSAARLIHEELNGTRERLKRITGMDPTLFRPPYGATDRKVRKEAEKEGVAQIMWSVDTVDWRVRNSDAVARRAIKGLRRNAIILMHDIHPTSVDAMPKILKAIKDKGFTAATVTDVLGGTTKPGKKYFGD